MRLKLQPELKKKLDRMRILAADIRADPVSDTKDAEEFRALQDELVPIFLPLVKTLVDADLITVCVEDKNGDFVPNHSSLWFNAADAWDNGNIFITAGDFAGGSLPRDKPGTEKTLYTWNSIDGDTGQPSRPITTQTNPFFRNAFLAGGEGWKAGTKENGVLVVNVGSTVDPATQQNPELYTFLFENYKGYKPNKFYAKEGMKAETFDLDAGKNAMWSVEVTLTEKNHTANGIDAIILAILERHLKQMTELHDKFVKRKDK